MDSSVPTPPSAHHAFTTTLHLGDSVQHGLVPVFLRTLPERIIAASLDVWSMYPSKMQINAIAAIVDIDISCGKVLLVAKTGSGKSHVMRTVGIMLGGVCLILMPLLALGTDQVAKLRTVCQEFGTVEFFHVDEYLEVPAELDKIVCRINSLQADDDSTVFIFCSPQALQNRPKVQQALLRAHSKLVLKSVFVDEVHLYVDHGTSFREDISSLTQSFFSLVFPPNNVQVHPAFCAMTGTFTKAHADSLHSLLGFVIPSTGVLWGSPSDFSKRGITIKYSVSDDFTTTAIKPMLAELQEGENGSIKGICYCNPVKDAERKLERINELLDGNVDFVGDAIIIHGQQHKLEKFVSTKIFLGQVETSSLKPVVLVATSAANCGIDDHRIRRIIRNGLPFGFLSLLQELGRAGRYKAATCDENSYHVVVNLKLFVQSLQLCHHFNQHSFKKANGEKMTPSEITLFKRSKKYSEDGTKHKLNLIKQIKRTFDLLRLFCLQRGCVHYILEDFAATGVLTDNIDFTKREPCGNACPYCTKEYVKNFPPIYKPDAIIWLAEVVSKAGTITCDDMLIDLLWEHPMYRYNIFGKNVAKYQVVGFLLQLLAVNILSTVTTVTKQSPVTCHLSYCTLNGKKCPLFHKEAAWHGFNIHHATRTRQYKNKTKQ
jgi:hypothetical protein